MTKHEFLSKLSEELNKIQVADTADIIGEYEQHFAFKMADGFSEAEIAAKLGDPALLAAEFERGAALPKGGGKKLAAVIGLGFAGLFAGAFFLVLIIWEVIMAVFSLTSAALAVCLFGGLNPYALISPMPYHCGLIIGVSLAALAVLVAVGCVYFAAFLGQLLRRFGRFHHNALARASGRPVLPALPFHPRLAPKTARRIRTVALTALLLFAACLVLGMIVAMLSAGALPFWHAWGWFGYSGAY